MSKTMILHHFEPIWESALKQMSGLSFYDYQEKVIKYLDNNHFDKLIITCFEAFKLTDEHFDYFHERARVETYDYGWTQEMADDNPNETWVKGGNHSEVVWVPKWLKNLKYNDVAIAGCFDGECIEDLEIALESQDISFKRVENLIF